MPKTGGRRYFPIRISDAGYQAIKQVADQEFNGNMSDAARKLLSEAIAARARKNTDR